MADPKQPAFPVVLPFEYHGAESGMTLRDWFAGQCCAAMVSSIDSEDNYLRIKNHAGHEGLSVSQWIAKDAYKQADAMLAEKERRDER